MTEERNVAGLHKVDTPRSFVKNYGASYHDSLFVFVGQKLEVAALPERYLSMDYCYKARYIVLKKLSGLFEGDTIEFVVFDHHGLPEFEAFTHVLLFVTASKGTYFHEKYMFNDVYQTKDGRWAGAYAISDYAHAYNQHTNIKPVLIDFIKEVSYPTIIKPEREKIKMMYPEPWYKTQGNKAMAVYGNYVEELYQLKNNGFLKARREMELN